MTTGNRLWSYGCAVLRVMNGDGPMTIYRHVRNADDYSVRASAAARPREFAREAEVTQESHGGIIVRPYGYGNGMLAPPADG